MSRNRAEELKDDVTEARESGNPEATGPHSLEGSEDELLRLQAENRSLFDRLARMTADFQNTRRRLSAETEQRVQYANADLIKSLLPVIDSFERALSTDPSQADAEQILKGMQIVHDQMMNVLAAHDVEEIVPQPGDSFDPSRHEALMQQDSEDHSPGSVTQLLEKGYGLHGRVIRPAKVAVSRGEG